MSSNDTGIERLNAAVWAAGFAMAPTEVDADASSDRRLSARWQPVRVAAKAAVEQATSVNVRQWLAGWQWRATA